MSHASEHPVKCEKCSATHPGSKFDNIRADAAGWYHKKNSTAYCPEHIPEYVKRIRRQQDKR